MSTSRSSHAPGGASRGGHCSAAAPRGDVDARIVGFAPADWDPAMQSDYGSAITIAQVFESLTAVDAQGAVQPALAATWSVEDGGRRVVFALRPGITDSAGTPITSADVVASWLRLIDPARPPPPPSGPPGVGAVPCRSVSSSPVPTSRPARPPRRSGWRRTHATGPAR